MRRMLQKLHLWIALILALPFLMLGLTGSILVFHQELLALETPALKGASTGPARPAGEIAAAAQAAAGTGLAVQAIILPDEPGDAAVVRLAARQRGTPPPAGPGGFTQVLVDPATLAVLGRRRPEEPPSLVLQIRQLHANLLMPGRDGRVIIGRIGAAMLFLGLTGPVLWWPRKGQWRAALTIRRGTRGLRLHRDLHGVIGIWTIGLFAAVTFSGVYLSFPRELGSAIASVLPGRDLRGTLVGMRVQPQRGSEPLGIDDAVALARKAAPDGRVRSVFVPARPDQPYRINLAPPGHRDGAPMMTAFVDPWQCSLIELRDPRGYGWGETVAAWQHALHAGEGLGLWWRLLVFLSGFLPVLFVVTGIAMWWLKRRARRVKRGTASGAAAEA